MATKRPETAAAALLPDDLLADLPGHDCGACGVRTCALFAAEVAAGRAGLERCTLRPPDAADHRPPDPHAAPPPTWRDALGRAYDFVLDTFPDEPGPQETILPHNPLATERLDVRPGDVLIGRPLGMSCGCPVTHCGVVRKADPVTGVIVWCVVGPLAARSAPVKDLGFYSAQAYDGLVAASRHDLRIGMRYWFLPHRCMLQWRHSGMVNFLRRSPDGLHVRVEGLLIG